MKAVFAVVYILFLIAASVSSESHESSETFRCGTLLVVILLTAAFAVWAVPKPSNQEEKQ